MGAPLVGNADHHFFPENLCGAGYRFQGNRRVAGIKQPVELRPARVKLAGHSVFRLPLSLHFLFELPCKDTFGGDGLDLFPNSLFFKEAVESGAAVIVSSPGLSPFHWIPLSCFSLFLRASAKSSPGVFCVFFMNPCSRTIRFLWPM